MSTNENDITPDITPLQLSDTFYTWFTTTNKLIEYVNPIQLYDINVGRGLLDTRLSGTVTIDIDTGKGVKIFPDIGTGALTIDIQGIYSAIATVGNDDYILFEKPNTDDPNDIFSVRSSDMLPPILNGNHEFLGDITVSVLNNRDEKIYIGYGSSEQAEAGIVIYPTETYEQSLLYNSSLDSWILSSNILIKNNKSFLSDSDTKDAQFRFLTNSNQYDVLLELAMGLSSTSLDDHSWKIVARHYLNSLDFVYSDTVNTDVDTLIFSARMDNLAAGTSTFIISDKIEIGNIGDSTTNFKQITNYTENIIPISNSYGVLDKKWTNRYVTEDYTGIAVGNLVKIYDDTNNTTTITRCDLSTASVDESDTFTFGIVEKISAGKAYIVLLGEFNLDTTPSPVLVPGTVYYLTTGSTNYTPTKPTTGLKKPVFIATGESSGVIFPMTSSTLSFGNVSVSAAGGAETGYIIGSGNTIYSNASNGNVELVAGNGITLETDNTTKTVTIRAITQGNEPGYSTIYGDSGTVLQAITPYDQLSITGNGGGIEVITDNSTNDDRITLQGSYFRSIAITGDETDTIDATITADVDAELTLYGGVGIRLTNPATNLIRIEATGDLAATIADHSLTLSQLQQQPKNSILYTLGATGSLSDVSTLQATQRSLLLYTGTNMTWATPISFFSTSVSGSGTGVIVPTTTRFMGISIHASGGSTTPIGGVNGTASFVFDSTIKPNSVDNVRLALIQGTGITLEVINNTASTDYAGVPGIKISNNDTTTKFRKLYLPTTGETIEADSSGILTFNSVSGSPVSLDADTTLDTVYFNIKSGSITNSHLDTMNDNTVKVGIGNTENIPTDLYIDSNNILGRLSGDLQSLDASDIRSILGLSGSSYYNEILTDNGSLSTDVDGETITIVGGPGISVRVNTNNEVEIANTLPDNVDADFGISAIGTRSLPTSAGVYTNTDIATGLYKLYFGIGDFTYTIEQFANSTAAITPKISWSTLGKTNTSTDNSISSGSGLMYGKPVSGFFTTQFSQIGNGVSGTRLVYIDADDNGSLKYYGGNNITTDSIVPTSGFLCFNNSGVLTTSSAYISGVSSGISGLNFSFNSSTRVSSLVENTTSPLTLNQYISTLGTYWFSNLTAIDLQGTNDFTFAVSNSPTSFSDVVVLKFSHSLFLDTSANTPTSIHTQISGTDLKVKNFGASWYSINTNIFCLPEKFIIGNGPNNNTSTQGSGYLLTNDNTNGALKLTNYNLNAYGSRTTSLDRSSKLSLEVINVDPGSSSTNYTSTRTTGYLVHCYSDPVELSAQGRIDTFTVTAASRRSIKYLIQATQATTNKVFTTEFIVQVNRSTNTCNYIQYASVSEPGGFTLDITAALNTSTGAVTVTCNSVTQSITLSSVKIMKLEM